MIKRITGNVLDFPEGSNCFIHGSNTLNIMGAGFAKTIKRLYPEVYEADTQHFMNCNQKIELGTFSKCWTREGHRVIYNLYQQDEIGTHKRILNYEAFEKGLILIRDDLASKEWLKNPKLAISSTIGCGLAGGNKNTVERIIRRVFKKAGFDVILVDYNGK